MQFLNLLDAIAGNINATNVEHFITLVENLIDLSETIVKNHPLVDQTSTNKNV